MTVSGEVSSEQQTGAESAYDSLAVSVPAESDAVRCRCLWNRSRCPNRATQEDMLCDWCGPHHVGIGGGGQAHLDATTHPPACWEPNSGQEFVDA